MSTLFIPRQKDTPQCNFILQLSSDLKMMNEGSDDDDDDYYYASSNDYICSQINPSRRSRFASSMRNPISCQPSENVPDLLTAQLSCYFILQSEWVCLG